MSTIVMIFALMVQPLVALNVPAAFAASVGLAPTSHLVDGGQTKISTVDASSFQNLTLSFSHVAEKLEDGDSLIYGWRVSGGANNQLGIIEGKENSGGNPGLGENGSKNHNLPGEAAVSNLEIYFTNTGATPAASDRVDITNIVINGDETASVVSSGEFTNPVASYNNGANYKGINVDVRYTDVSGLTGLSVAVNRSSGGSVTKIATQARIDAINGQNGVASSTTVPIIVQHGTYDEAGSSSWLVPTNTLWTEDTIPENVVITMTFADGSSKSTAPLSIGEGSATYAQIAPEAPVVPEPCNLSTFDSGFTLGSVNGQNGWSAAGPFDQSIVDNIYGYSSFGCKSLRFSNGVTSGSFGDQVFSYSVANEAGEASAENGGQSGGTRQNYFEASWDFASTNPSAEQTGLSLTASPDRGDGARMSWIRMYDSPTGLALEFADYQKSVDDFVYTTIASNLDRSTPHNVKVTMEFVDGVANDIVKVYVDGALVHTGTSWEDYFRDGEGNPTRTVDSVLFRASGTAVPANAGEGFLFDNLSITTSQTTVVDTEKPSAPTITTPVNEQYFKSAPIQNEWSASTDNVGVVKYQVAYRYDDGHTFGGSTCPAMVISGQAVSGCRDTTATSRNHGPNTSEQGGVRIWVRAFDAAGNASDWSTPVHYYYDTTNPVLIVDNLHEGDLIRTNNTDNKLTLKGEYSDNIRANYTVFYLIKDGVLKNTQILHGAKPAGSTLAEFDTTALGLVGGDYELQINATDLAGNIYSQTINFTLDNDAPVVAITAPTDGAVTNQPVAIRGTVTDAHPRHYWVQVKRNGSVIYSQTVLISASFVDQLLRNVTADGDYEVTLAARDAVGGTANSGNRSSDAVVHFTIDTEAPAMPTHESPADNSFQNSNDFYFEWSDIPGAIEYEFQSSQSSSTDGNGSLNSGVWNNKLNGGADQNHLTDSRIHSYGANGTWYWQVRAVDVAGNKSAWTTPWKITIDMVAPDVPSASFTQDSDGAGVPSGGGTNSQFFTFALNSSADTTRYQLKYWNDITGSSFKESTPWNPTDLSGYSSVLGTYKDTFTQGEGTHYFSFSACDAAGNCSAYGAPFVVTFDETPPALTLNSVPNSTGTSRTISGTSDPFAHIEVTVHSTPQTKSTTADAVGNWSLLFEGLEVGSHTVKVISTDVNGNVSEQLGSFTVLALTSIVPLFTPRSLAVVSTPQPFSQGFAGNNPNTTTSPVDSNIVAFNSDDTAADNSTVLSAQDDEAGSLLEDTDVLGMMDNKFFGLVWYWWLIALGALVGGWLLIAAAIRRKRSQE